MNTLTCRQNAGNPTFEDLNLKQFSGVGCSRTHLQGNAVGASVRASVSQTPFSKILCPPQTCD